MSSPPDRHTAYAELVRTRKECRACAGLVNPAMYECGIYDSDQIGPWSLWQGNLHAQIVIVGQDWGDVRYFSDKRGHDDPYNRTNETLRGLLHLINVEIAAPSPADAGGGTIFLTNAILCLKHGGMQANVRPDWFSQCGSRFLKPTIELIAPRMVVTLGERAYEAVTASYGVSRIPLREAVSAPEGFALPGGVMLFPVYHCGGRSLNTHRPLAQQLRDWQRVARALQVSTAAISRRAELAQMATPSCPARSAG